MKLLFDQNLSRHLVEWLKPLFDQTAHVTSLGLENASDEEIWNFARDNGYTIVSKEADFHHMSFRYGAPPKTVWIRLGNCSTRQVSACLARNLSTLTAFIDDAESALMVITENSVETGRR